MSTITRTTRLIETATGTYPLFLSALSERLPNAQFPTRMEAADLLEWGYEEVLDTDVPQGDVVVEGVPELRDGSYYRTWLARPFTETELAANLVSKKAQLLVDAETLRDNRFEQGFPYQFGENVYHVQIRDKDCQNISTLRMLAKEAVDAAVEFPVEFRVYENVSVSLTAAEMVTMATAAFQAVTAGYRVIWVFKDAVAAATTIEELPVPPAELFTL
jgi:hypothetical protein